MSKHTVICVLIVVALLLPASMALAQSGSSTRHLTYATLNITNVYRYPSPNASHEDVLPPHTLLHGVSSSGDGRWLLVQAVGVGQVFGWVLSSDVSELVSHRVMQDAVLSAGSDPDAAMLRILHADVPIYVLPDDDSAGMRLAWHDDGTVGWVAAGVVVPHWRMTVDDAPCQVLPNSVVMHDWLVPAGNAVRVREYDPVSLMLHVTLDDAFDCWVTSSLTADLPVVDWGDVDLPVEIRLSGIALREIPHRSGRAIDLIANRETVAVVGRSTSADYLLVVTPRDALGWLHRDMVQLVRGVLFDLPEIEEDVFPVLRQP